MTLEIWMVVVVGVAFTVGFGAMTVLLLGLHAEIRRLSRLAEAAQRVFADNLRQSLPPKSVASSPSPAPAVVDEAAIPADPPPEPIPELALPLVDLAAATGVNGPPVHPEEPPRREPDPAEPANGPAWNPDRRLLVMRLASRGRNAEQIAAALRIPQEEVELFLEANKLVARKADVPT